jgi:uncharacterized protein
MTRYLVNTFTTLHALAPTMFNLPVPVVTIGLLALSNMFMTLACYDHLKFMAAPLVAAILISWGITFLEYDLQVPANRTGDGYFSAAESKSMQEVLTLSIFAVFSVFSLKQPLGWKHLLGFGIIALGSFFIFHKWGTA